MKVPLDKKQIIFFSLIILACIIAIIIAIYIQFFAPEESKMQEGTTSSVSTEELKNNFSNIFDNNLYQENNGSNISKQDDAKDIVYTSYKKTENIDGKYDVNVHIPMINIKNETIDKYNKQINDIFMNKANAVLAQTNGNTIYDVEYVAYLNNSVLSLAIKSTLKEGENPQRVIVKTYNYDLEKQKEITIQDMIQKKGLEEQQVQNKIKESIKNEMEQAKALQEIGYTVYHRDLRNEIYQLDKTNTFLLGKDQVLYVIYPYGNTNYTSELDIVIFE